MAVHVLFEQGALGLAAWVLLLAGALARVTVGAARAHALAPVLAAALVSVVVVGAVDSLLDMTRIAFLMLFLAGVALTLPAQRRP
jgi:O-antigen ligase